MMNKLGKPAWRTYLQRALMLLAITWLGWSSAAQAQQDARPDTGAATLQEKYQALQPQLMHNQFARPLYINSSETGDSIKGDIYAVVDYPFAQLRTTLTRPANWCDVLILHLNTKYCHANSTAGSDAAISLRVGKKTEQPVEQAYLLDFGYHLNTSRADYFDIRLNAAQGPLDTHDYHIRLEAIPGNDGRSFLHLMYSYSFGFTTRVAMRTYLATAGSNKVGFTRESPQDEPQVRYIGGMRGSVERNTMRYYLAIDAYLSSLTAPPPQQLEQRLQTWFDATERYPRQLHEVERDDYLKMKRNEYARQNSEQK